MSDTTVYTLREVAERLQMSEHTLARLARAKKLPCRDVGTGEKRARWRMTEDDIQQFLAERRVKRPKEPRRSTPAAFRSP